MRKSYVLQHEYELNGCDEVKLIGIYSSEMKAREAIEKLRVQPGFRDYPDGFSIDCYELDKECWAEGFVRS